jgi:hypothetical protein
LTKRRFTDTDHRSLARIESDTQNVSALGAVMAFLYSSYIVIYAIASVCLGTYIDHVSFVNGDNIQPAIRNVAGIQFTIIAILVMTSTFVPKGAFALNPKMLSEEPLDTDLEDEDLEYVPGGYRNKNSHDSHEMVSRVSTM